jgi:transposase
LREPVMGYREVSVVEVREVLRRWVLGEGQRSIDRNTGVDRKTVHRYVEAAESVGVVANGDVSQLDDGVIGMVCLAVRPDRPRGHGAAWEALEPHAGLISGWVKDELTVVKIHDLLARRGVEVPHRTLHRFAVARCGYGKRASTVRVADGEPGGEVQVDFGKMGLVGDPVTGRNRVTHALIFTACYSRHCFVWLTHHQTTGAVIAGFEAAWAFFGGVFKVVIPDNMSSIVVEADACEPRFTDAFVEYSQSRGFVIDAARVRTPTDKACVSHCTSWVGCDEVLLRAVFGAGWSADGLAGHNSGDLVVMLAFLVESFAGEAAFVVPGLDGRSADAEAGGGFFDGDEAAVA